MPLAKAAAAAFVVFGTGTADPAGKIPRMLRSLALALSPLALALSLVVAVAGSAANSITGGQDFGVAQDAPIMKVVE